MGQGRFSAEELSHIIEMAWSDDVSFDDIYYQTGLKEAEIKIIMKANLKDKSYKNWRKRVEKNKKR